MSSKRQQTMAKIARERTVSERRERKLEKKQAAAAERKERKALGLGPTDPLPQTGDVVRTDEPGEPTHSA